jgi:hypothetical protein
MSIPVTVRDLATAIREREASAYIVTVSDTGTPHVVPAGITQGDDGLIADVGERTAHNARGRPHVSLLYAACRPDDYSLIVDAVASVDAAGLRLTLRPTRAVLHRLAGVPYPATSACGSDCIPLSLTP